jgi:acetylornithine deacetylase/succinyl-diaminopimelate desuccinylase-like protein
MSNFESKDYGFEYRTPPAGYMADPEMTRIVFKACQGLMQTYLAGERFKVKKHPDAEDYKRICGLTDKEYAYFVDFIQNKYPKIDKKHVLKNWLSGKVRTTGTLRFEEGWDRNCAQRFRDELANNWMSKNGIHFDIVLFGLRNSRGLVCTLPVTAPPGVDAVGLVANDTARQSDDKTLYVGIPHSMRHIQAYANVYAPLVMDAVKTAARKKEREARAAKLPALMSLIDEPVHHFDAVPAGA